jgi:hypothetical protein
MAFRLAYNDLAALQAALRYTHFFVHLDALVKLFFRPVRFQYRSRAA